MCRNVLVRFTKRSFPGSNHFVKKSVTLSKTLFFLLQEKKRIELKNLKVCLRRGFSTCEPRNLMTTRVRNIQCTNDSATRKDSFRKKQKLHYRVEYFPSPKISSKKFIKFSSKIVLSSIDIIKIRQDVEILGKEIIQLGSGAFAFPKTVHNV